MANLTQSKLVRQAEIFVTNGAKSEAQGVIAGVGYNPAGLADGQALITAVKTNQAISKAQLAAQKAATQAEKTARTAAQKEITSLSETARILFANDEPTLTALGLLTKYETIVDSETGEEKQQAIQGSKATADVIARWRQRLTNTITLEASLKAQLTTAGWTATRLTTAQTLVEAFATADIAQQDATQNYQQASAQYKEDETVLRQWYARARNLCTIAIKDVDPKNQQNLRELLGLDG